MTRRILVPLDGSDLAEQVLPVVDDLISRLEAEVCFVRVIPRGSAILVAASAGTAASGELVLQELEAQAEAARNYLSNLASKWRDRGSTVSVQILIGDPAEEIIGAARTHKVWLIAMSTHGRFGLSRLITGSIADKVLRGTSTPVLLLRSRSADRRKAARPETSRRLEERSSV